jgi:hypothetical protein
MLGWDVMVFRKIPRPQPEKAEELLLARWATGVFGLKWLDDLVRSNRAVDLVATVTPVATPLLPAFFCRLSQEGCQQIPAHSWWEKIIPCRPVGTGSWK